MYRFAFLIEHEPLKITLRNAIFQNVENFYNELINFAKEHITVKKPEDLIS